MNYDDIKDALTVCASIDCEGCRYHDNELYNCYDKLKRDARELIIKQENEIKKLKAENARLTEKLKRVLLSIDTVKEMNTMCNIDEQNAEIERLKAEIERLKDDYARVQELFAQYQIASDKEIAAQVKQAKIDVLTELKKKTYVNDYCREVVEVEKIDEMIKELIK